MTARQFIKLLEQLPASTQIDVDSKVLAALKRIARKNPAYLSDEEEDELDLKMLAKRPKRDRSPLISHQAIKKEFGIR